MEIKNIVSHIHAVIAGPGEGNRQGHKKERHGAKQVGALLSSKVNIAPIIGKIEID